MNAILILAGLAGLLLGGTWLVAGAAGLALRLAVPPLLIGLTVVGFGTSAPELMVSVLAALDGAGGIAIGNVVGSNIANILLILGLSAAIAPLAIPFARIRRDLAFMLAAALVCAPLFWNGTLGPVEGTVLLAGLALFLWQGIRYGAASAEPLPGSFARPAAGPALLRLLAGLALVLAGAQALVTGATGVARELGVTEALIGLTIVAVGTSLPELATSVIAAARGEREIAIGNVVGSNVFNVFAILGLTALIAPVPVEPRFLSVDVPVMIVVSLALAALVAFRGGMGRAAGAGFLALYAAYVAGSAAL